MNTIISANKLIPLTTSAMAVFFVACLSTPALADNKEALKDATPAVTTTTTVETKDVKTVDADFKKLDANSDGKISLKEAVKDKTLAAKFDASDVNHDGMLSLDEYANYKTVTSMKPTDGATPPVTN